LWSLSFIFLDPLRCCIIHFVDHFVSWHGKNPHQCVIIQCWVNLLMGNRLYKMAPSTGPQHRFPNLDMKQWDPCRLGQKRQKYELYIIWLEIFRRFKSGHEMARSMQARPKKVIICGYISSELNFWEDSKIWTWNGENQQRLDQKRKSYSSKFLEDSKSGHEMIRFMQAKPKKVIIYVMNFEMIPNLDMNGEII